MPGTDFDAEHALLDAMDARVDRLEATRKVASALGLELDRVAEDLAACKELRKMSIRTWKKQAGG
jgi:hypothetical protein